MIVSRFGVPAFLALFVACAAQDEGGGANAIGTGQRVDATAAVEDGVPVKHHTADAFDRAPRFQIDPQPLAVLGGANADPAYDLTYANDVVLLMDGRIATLAGIGSRLLIFQANGEGERSLVRQGAGPREIMGPSGVTVLRGDTLFVPDRANRRFNWILPDRGVVLTRPMDDFRAEGRVVFNNRIGGLSELMAFMRAIGALSDGRIVMSSAGLGQEGVADSISRPLAPVAILDLEARTLKPIASIPDWELVMEETRYRGRPRLSTTFLAFGRSAQIVAWDSVVATSGDGGYRIDLRNDSGRVVSRLEVDRPRRPVTSSMREALIARELERLNTASGERLVDPEESRRLARETPFADSLPDYEDFFVSPGNTLWVVDAIALSDSGWSATAFDQQGGIIGRLNVSVLSRPMAFGDDRVVLRTTDENDIVSFQVHRIVEAP